MMPCLYVVHCVDAEGPLWEDLGAVFRRLESLGIDLGHMPHNQETLAHLQAGEINLGARRNEIAKFLSPERLEYNDNFSKLDHMIRYVASPEFRNAYPDAEGNGWTFSWFIMDFVGFTYNPRRRPEGFHVMWDWYHKILRDCIEKDGFYWHFHTVPVSGHGTEYNPCWTNNDFHEQVLCRRILDRGWFPAVYRAGGHIESLDLSNWLELFIPFDYSRADMLPGYEKDFLTGDWRGAPVTWRGFNPTHDDYRRPGDMRRRVFRCVEINNGRKKIDRETVASAFAEAATRGKAVLAISNHDRRNLAPEILHVYELLTECANDWPEVVWTYRNALEAAVLCGGLPESYDAELSVEAASQTLLTIESRRPTFGPVPFVAVLNKDGVYYRDNPNIEEPFRRWVFKIRRPNTIKAVGIAASYPDGKVSIRRWLAP